MFHDISGEKYVVNIEAVMRIQLLVMSAAIRIGPILYQFQTLPPGFEGVVQGCGICEGSGNKM